ncbi:MAG: hypothetical protein P1U64_09730 [Alcanivoracaceae bacterium]|nr:hypothetical protein [Alcanivoracaceae bacterium]
MNAVLIILLFALPILYFLWRQEFKAAAISLGLRTCPQLELDVDKSELLKQVQVRAHWLKTEDDIYVSRCGFDSGRAAFSFPGHIVVGKILPVPSQVMALTDEARRVYGKGYEAAGTLLNDTQFNIVVFEDTSDAEAFLAFVERWRKKVSIEIVESLLLVSCGWRSEDVEQAIEIVREYRRSGALAQTIQRPQVS